MADKFINTDAQHDATSKPRTPNNFLGVPPGVVIGCAPIAWCLAAHLALAADGPAEQGTPQSYHWRFDFYNAPTEVWTGCRCLTVGECFDWVGGVYQNWDSDSTIPTGLASGNRQATDLAGIEQSWQLAAAATAAEMEHINADYDAIMEEYGEEELDRLTALVNDIESEKLERHEEQKIIQLNRMKQETLFNIKLEAFEIEIVKNSKNKELKKLIRKAKTPLEVQAYTTILIQKEMDTHE